MKPKANKSGRKSQVPPRSSARAAASRKTTSRKAAARISSAASRQQLLDVARAPHVATARVVAESGSDVAQSLYLFFHQANGKHFASRLAAPLILVTGTNSARTLGDYCPRDLHGLDSRIRIAPKAVKHGELFTLDVLLHEMVHAWANEVNGDIELSYRGHGPDFAAKCNDIGFALGLGGVGVKGRDGLPDCAHWPMCVRPEGYYPEPYTPPTRKAKEEAAEPNEPSDDDGESDDTQVLFNILAAVGQLDAHAVDAIADACRRRIRQLGKQINEAKHSRR